MTKTQFKRKAEQAFLRSNPSAEIGDWISAQLVTFPTGIKEFVGRFSATAPGYRSKIMIATGAADYVMVR